MKQEDRSNNIKRSGIKRQIQWPVSGERSCSLLLHHYGTMSEKKVKKNKIKSGVFLYHLMHSQGKPINSAFQKLYLNNTIDVML